MNVCASLNNHINISLIETYIFAQGFGPKSLISPQKVGLISLNCGRIINIIIYEKDNYSIGFVFSFDSEFLS